MASKKVKPAAKSASSKKNKTLKVSPPKKASPSKSSSKIGGNKKTSAPNPSLKKKTRAFSPPKAKPAKPVSAAKPVSKKPKPVPPKQTAAKKAFNASSKTTQPKPKTVLAQSPKPSPKPSPKVLKPKPVVAKPSVAKPVLAKPVVAKPAVAKPVVAKPVLAKPVLGKKSKGPLSHKPSPLLKKSSWQAKVPGEEGMAVEGGMDTRAENLGPHEVQESVNWAMFFGPPPDKPSPKLSELPTLMGALNRRAMEQVLTVGSGRGVAGEGSMKGKLLLHMGFPYLEVMGRDRRELYFLLQGPDQEVLPAYSQHWVSVSGLIRKTHNYGGSIDVRKYSAKSTEPEAEPAPVAPEPPKLQFLSPGELQQITTPGMGAGMRGFASVRGILELSGEDHNLVLGGQGTWQQVSLKMEGKAASDLRRCVGQTLHVTGVIEKETGWSGRILTESYELRAPTLRALSREGLDIYTINHLEETPSVLLEGHQALLVCLTEVPRYIWTVDIAAAKRLGLREVVSRPHNTQEVQVQKEFFFLPRMPGVIELDFFLSKIASPQQFERSLRLHVTVLPS